MKKKLDELLKKLETVQGSKCLVYSRAVGYIRPVQNWNDGKKEEFKNRSYFKAYNEE